MTVARFNFENKSVDNFEVIFQSNAFSIGSRIAWQDDTHLFVSQGLGGNPYPEPGAQNLNHDGGKIHRLKDDGEIPPDNPIFFGFVSPGSIWSFGHRDPQGLYYDSINQVLYSNEHGPLGGDEFNLIVKGGNFGWPLFSYGLNYDNTPVSDMTEEEAALSTELPIKYWRNDFNIAPSSLSMLTNSNFESWNGSFVMGSLAQRNLIGYNLDTGVTKILIPNTGRLRDIAQLPSGDLLILIDDASPRPSDRGRIVKISPL